MLYCSFRIKYLSHIRVTIRNAFKNFSLPPCSEKFRVSSPFFVGSGEEFVASLRLANREPSIKRSDKAARSSALDLSYDLRARSDGSRSFLLFYFRSATSPRNGVPQGNPPSSAQGVTSTGSVGTTDSRISSYYSSLRSTAESDRTSHASSTTNYASSRQSDSIYQSSNHPRPARLVTTSFNSEQARFKFYRSEPDKNPPSSLR